ncbi:hypothetical protein P7C70_g7384, partial [Phenoliferia sp. Uapishka_3]
MSKRAASPPSSSQPPAKRAPATLSTWLNVAAPTAPSILVSSPPLTDRASTFVCHATTCTSSHAATQFQSFVRALRAPSHPTESDHEMMAWRTMVLKVGKTGEDEGDWVVRYGSEDDGEKSSGATLRKCLEEEAAVDVCVVVSRYYGGIMLGPDRFTHMRTVTTQALSKLAVHFLVTELRSLDTEIDSLITSPFLYTIDSKLSIPPPVKYDGMPKDKVERLIKAREKRRDFLKGEVEKKEREWEEKIREEKEREEAEKELYKQLELAVEGAVEFDGSEVGEEGLDGEQEQTGVDPELKEVGS